MLCKSCEPEIALKVIKIVLLSTKALNWCLTQYLIQNKNNFTATNLTKCVNQHCRELGILKKISICFVFIQL